jgi:hypothetical protein
MTCRAILLTIGFFLYPKLLCQRLTGRRIYSSNNFLTDEFLALNFIHFSRVSSMYYAEEGGGAYIGLR